MGSSFEGSTVTPHPESSGADPEADSSEAERPGFFGRLLSAFSGGDPQEDAAPAAAAAAPQQLPGLANLRKLRVDDVAIPKVEIAAVPLDIGKDELVEVFRAQGFSRLPVYKGTLDHPQGRCSRMPRVKPELVPGAPTPTIESGPEWLARQPEGVQRSVLGPRRFDLWARGDYPASRWAVRRESPDWRASYAPGPIN